MKCLLKNLDQIQCAKVKNWPRTIHWSGDGFD